MIFMTSIVSATMLRLLRVCPSCHHRQVCPPRQNTAVACARCGQPISANQPKTFKRD
jgi:ribosomal protein S27E